LLTRDGLYKSLYWAPLALILIYIRVVIHSLTKKYLSAVLVVVLCRLAIVAIAEELLAVDINTTKERGTLSNCKLTGHKSNNF